MGRAQDTRIRYNEAERHAVKTHSVQAFCLSNQNLAADEMAKRFIDNIDAIEAAAAEAGPFICAVHQNRIDRLAIADE